MIDRKRYLELCQQNASFPKSVLVDYNGQNCYPKSLTIWFDSKGSVQNTANIIDSTGRCEIHCGIWELTE